VFTDISTSVNSTITTWGWTFGDGGTSIAASPTHTYATAGTYTVTLQVTTDKGCTDDSVRTVVVNPLPSASFTVSSPLCETQAVTFTNASVPNAGTLTEWDWDFGDGTPLTINNEHQLNHVYAQTGKYKVCLIDSFCPTNTMFCDSIKVENSKEVQARFTHQDFGNGTFIFNNSSVASNYPIITYQWDFGDGNISNDKVVKHNYHSSGQYVVSLTVLDSGNNFDIFYDTVNTTVTVPCYADFNFQYVNNQFEFQNLSSSPDSLVGYQWYFGDASNVNTQVNPTHGYNAIGNYTVTLVMKSATCSDTIQKTISQPDTALCNIKFTSLVNYQKVLFNVTSNNQEPLFEKYLIDYGDLTQDYMQTNSISHIYTDTGSYKVCVYWKYIV
jgi:PKD repeat protein